MPNDETPLPTGQEIWKAAEKDAEAYEKAQAAKRGAAAHEEPEEEAEPPAEDEAPETEPESPSEAENAKPDDEEKAEPKDQVFNSEKVKLRRERRELREKQAALEAQFAEREAKLAERESGSRAALIEKALEAGDLDAIGRALGHKDWNGLQEVAALTQASPAYKELRALKKKAEEREQREAEEANQHRTRAQQEAAARQEQANVAALSKDMKAMGGLVADFAEEPWMVNSVLAVLKQEFAGQSHVTHEEVEDAVPGAIARVLEETLKTHRSLSDKFSRHEGHDMVKKYLKGPRQTKNSESGNREPNNLETRSPQRVNRGKPKPSHSRISDASHSREPNDAEARRQFIEAVKREQSAS